MKDLPDYTREMVIRYEGGFIGLEELAARLGSIVPWDLHGNIVLMEDFESELTEWSIYCDALGSTAVRSSRHKYSGDWALKLDYMEQSGAYAGRYHYFHFPGITKYAAFARFGSEGTCPKICLSLGFYNGTREYYIEVDYNLPTTTLSIKTTGWVDHNVDTIPQFQTDYFTWYPVLVTFDLESGYYDKLYFADREYDISSVPLDYEETGADPEGYIYVIAEYSYVAKTPVYVDDIIIAKNVP